MKQIPLHRKGNAILLNAKINNAFSTEFQLDTGCWNTVISKEIADMLYLRGKLSDDDITGHENANWGNHYQTRVPTFKIKKLSFGQFAISDIQASICNRYGGPTLFGMSCLDKLKNYTITEKCISVEDGKEEVKKLVLKQARTVKNYVRYCHNQLKKLHKVREENPEANYKFDYKIWCFSIFGIISNCFNPLHDKDKFDKVIPILEDLRSLIQKNLEYDQEHPDEHGAFISGYFNFYLGTAYFQADRREESIDYYEKAKTFFMEGTSTRQEIDDQIAVIKEKIRKETKEEPSEPEPKLVPMRTMDFEGDVKLLGLNKVEIVDNVYGSDEKKNVLTGFKDFKTAFDFSITYHKRLEIIKRVDGVWYRTDKIPTDDLAAFDLDLADKYVSCYFKSDVEHKAKELTEALDSNDTELAERIEHNKEKAIDEIKKLPGKYSWKYGVILKKDDLSYDCTVSPGGSLKWHDTDIAICAIDVDDSIAKRLVDDVLAGKFIPCALGQMPEDFLFLHEKYDYFRTHNEDQYTGNNNPEYSKWIVGDFVVMDSENSIGYSYRGTYDNIHWRWECGNHSNHSNLMKSGEDINKNEDYTFCYWQLVRNKDAESSDYISSKPF